MTKRDDEESGNRRAGARGITERELNAPYEDPIDKLAREADSIDEREYSIALLMAQGRWSKLKALQYANVWAVSPKTVANYASNANNLRRQVAGARGLKSAQRRTLDQLQAAYELAMANGDAKAATMAAKTMGEIQGAFPSKHAGKGAQQPGPGVPAPLPPAVQELAESPEALRLWALIGKRPSKAQVAQLSAGATAEQVAEAAGRLLKPPGGS